MQAKENEVLQTMKNFLGLEHFAWKFSAIASVISAAFLFFCTFFMTAAGIVLAEAESDPGNKGMIYYAFIIFNVMFLYIDAIALVPRVVISFILLKKVEYYQSTIDTDISIARKRCTSVGMIVFCVLFNTLAAVFYVINFALTKKNAAEFDKLEAAQKGN